MGSYRTHVTSTTWFTTTTTTDSSYNARDNHGTLKRNAYDKEGRHDTPKTADQKVDQAATLQLGEHVARELGLRFRASPPHSQKQWSCGATT